MSRVALHKVCGPQLKMTWGPKHGTVRASLGSGMGEHRKKLREKREWEEKKEGQKQCLYNGTGKGRESFNPEI